jgi:zinc transport system substrate-binding protein
MSLFTLLCTTASYAKVNVVVSIIPQQTFVEKIGGDNVNVTTMVKPGSDPHSYEPKPSQMIAISKADIYFPIKIEFENAWLNKFKDQNKNMQFIQMTKGVTFIDMPEHENMEDEHDGHDEAHGDEELPFEWAGAFDLKKGEYTWSFDKVDGKYADPKMRFLMIKTLSHDEDIIEHYEPQAEKIFESKTKVAKHGDNIDTNKQTFELVFDQNKNQTLFKVSIKEDGKYIFFTEHMPFEFEDKEHFFKDLAKNDVEPFAQHPQSGGHHHHHHHHGENDPHTWVSPANVKIMAKNIYDALVQKDSSNADYYKKNYEKFLSQINATDTKIKNILSNTPKNSKFMVFHPSWGYFAKEYGLTQIAIEVEGKEPKPKMLQKIIKKAKQDNIKAIFTQKEFSDKSAKVIASQLNIKVIKETPLAKDWSNNLIKIANAIANNN